MQKAGNSSLQFRNWKARWFLPLVPYFDTESCIVLIATAQPSTFISQTVATEKHESCGFAIAAIEHNEAFPAHFEHIRSNFLKKYFVVVIFQGGRNTLVTLVAEHHNLHQ